MTIGSVFDHYLEGLITANQKKCYDIVHSALKEGLTLQAIYEEVFFPAMVEIGRLWEINRLSVAQEHLATAITQQVMASLYESLFNYNPGATHCKVIVTCPAQETHELASRMFADLLVLHGADVLYLGANVPIKDVLSMTQSERPTYVGVSCTIENHLSHARQLISDIVALSMDNIKIVIGGRAFEKHYKDFMHYPNVVYARSFGDGLLAMQLV